MMLWPMRLSWGVTGIFTVYIAPFKHHCEAMRHECRFCIHVNCIESQLCSCNASCQVLPSVLGSASSPHKKGVSDGSAHAWVYINSAVPQEGWLLWQSCTPPVSIVLVFITLVLPPAQAKPLHGGTLWWGQSFPPPVCVSVQWHRRGQGAEAYGYKN